MEHWRWLISKVVTILAAAAFLFVVVFPYTPTPLALTISKILVAVTALLGGVLLSRAIDIAYRQYESFKESSSLFLADEILDLICLRLQ